MRLKFAVVAAVIALASVAHSQAADQDINLRCSAKWGDDFSMQDYCRQKQLGAAAWMYDYIKRYGITTKHQPVEGKILEKCYNKWTDSFGPDWVMVQYCTEKQLAAYRRVK